MATLGAANDEQLPRCELLTLLQYVFVPIVHLTYTSPAVQIMMAVYEKARSSYIYFLAFILLSTFFMMNLFTAVVYSKYTTLEDQYEKHALARTERHLTTAFSMLDIDCSGELSKVEMLAVVNQLRKAHLLPELQGGVTASLLFAALDSERNNVISKGVQNAFCACCTMQVSGL